MFFSVELKLRTTFLVCISGSQSFDISLYCASGQGIWSRKKRGPNHLSLRFRLGALIPKAFGLCSFCFSVFFFLNEYMVFCFPIHQKKKKKGGQGIPCFSWGKSVHWRRVRLSSLFIFGARATGLWCERNCYWFLGSACFSKGREVILCNNFKETSPWNTKSICLLNWSISLRRVLTTSSNSMVGVDML